jgi:hypothetical protein
MADLNALIAQGAQFNMPDQLGQYAKMQQLQAGQQQMRTGALQEQTASMQLQKLQEDRANMAALSQKLSVKGVTPRQYFEALQTSGDPQHQQLGIEGLMKLDATEAFDRSQQTIPGQTPARVGGELGSGTAFMDNALPGMPAPVNALATRAAAPAASTNALAPTPAAADSAVSAIEAKMQTLLPHMAIPRAQEQMKILQEQRKELLKRYTVGDTLMNPAGNVVGTAPAKAVAPRMHVVNGNLVRDDGTVVFTAPKAAGDGTGVAKAPSGYRVTATGDLEAIPGGPAAGKPLTQLQEVKLRTDVAKDYKSASTTLSQMDDLLESINQVKTAPGLSAATGYLGKLPSFSEGAAAQAESRLANLRGKVTALGKATAAMSGSIGSIANQEWKILSDQIAALDEVKGKGPLLEQIDLVEQQAKGAIARIRDQYDKTRSDDFERFPQFRDLPASKQPGGTPAAPQGTGGFKYLGTEGTK